MSAVWNSWIASSAVAGVVSINMVVTQCLRSSPPGVAESGEGVRRHDFLAAGGTYAFPDQSETGHYRRRVYLGLDPLEVIVLPLGRENRRVAESVPDVIQSVVLLGAKHPPGDAVP